MLARLLVLLRGPAETRGTQQAAASRNATGIRALVAAGGSAAAGVVLGAVWSLGEAKVWRPAREEDERCWRFVCGKPKGLQAENAVKVFITKTL